MPDVLPPGHCHRSSWGPNTQAGTDTVPTLKRIRNPLRPSIRCGSASSRPLPCSVGQLVPWHWPCSPQSDFQVIGRRDGKASRGRSASSAIQGWSWPIWASSYRLACGGCIGWQLNCSARNRLRILAAPELAWKPGCQAFVSLMLFLVKRGMNSVDTSSKLRGLPTTT